MDPADWRPTPDSVAGPRHARSGDRIALAAYLGKSDTFDQALADFAESYADQNEKDHAALAAAVAPESVPEVT